MANRFQWKSSEKFDEQWLVKTPKVFYIDYSSEFLICADSEELLNKTSLIDVQKCVLEKPQKDEKEREEKTVLD